jgi:hypothetical protein
MFGGKQTRPLWQTFLAQWSLHGAARELENRGHPAVAHRRHSDLCNCLWRDSDRHFQ